MFPTEALTSASLDSLLFSTSLLGLLIFVGVVLRLKVKILKKLFIPASLIAGVLGLILGQYGFGIIPKDITATWGALPGRLITVVFAPMLMGMEIPNVRKVWNQIAPQLYFSYIGDFIQIAIPFIISALILEPIWKVNPMFASVVEVGWAGGHGTAGGMIDVYNSLNWPDGGDLGLTSATVGPRLFKTNWFENAIVNYGFLSGVAAVGLMLLRISDPNMETEAGESFALRTPLFEPLLGGGLITSLLPIFGVKYGSLKTGIAFLILTIIGIILAKITGFWNKREKVASR